MINELIKKGKTFLEKGRKVKSRGIALTHVDQGYSANQRHVSLLMKSDIDPENLTVDIVKNLEQVQLKVSMEEFLRRFFDMWSSDAELLTKVLGYKTEFEQRTEDNPPEGEWEKKWNEEHQEYISDRLESITLLKAAHDGKELTAQERYALIETRKAFESGCIEQSLEFEKSTTASQPAEEKPTNPVAVTPVIKQKAEVATPPATNESSSGAKPEHTKETPVDKEVDVTKSTAFIELQKQLEAMQTDVLAAKEIIKAKQAADKAVAINKAASMPFVDEASRPAIADVILNPDMAVVVSVLEKAVADLAAKDEALVAKDLEIAEVKKSFASGKEDGANGELTPEAKGAEDAQAALDRIIKAKVAKATKAATE